ncbi:hypothetical protein DPMN_045485 [Dreissena polymorpha]|uniref:Uncharacterized protein n=1 Tax=Dreissena polymorpha TaxID=45954 RepID=A0A9D4D4Z8_DREPO|nr:hypothetical protein DPMN_045485 [Dreissena polymorpha]
MMSSGNQKWKTISSLSYFRHKEPKMQTRRLFKIDKCKMLPLEPGKKGSCGPRRPTRNHGNNSTRISTLSSKHPCKDQWIGNSPPSPPLSTR